MALIKRDVRVLAGSLGFSAVRMNELDIIIAELTSNLVKYARAIPDATNAGIELISADAGPGMVDTARIKTDGVSTGGRWGRNRKPLGDYPTGLNSTHCRGGEPSG